MTTQRSILLAAGLFGALLGGPAQAQLASPPVPIPNGLSGPGGTTTFTTTPAVQPNIGANGLVGISPSTHRLGGSTPAIRQPSAARRVR